MSKSGMKRQSSEILVPLGAEIRRLNVKEALTPNALIFGEVGIVVSLFCHQYGCIIGVARQRPEPHGLTRERLES